MTVHSAYLVFATTAIVAIAGCTVNPITGRSQLIALPAAQAAHSDMGFNLATAQGLTLSAPCAGMQRITRAAGTMPWSCPDTAGTGKFALQVERLGAELAVQARLLAPALFTRISAFQIEVKSNVGAGTASSAGGRIILDAGLATLEPTDDVVAFLIAREMGNVIARHGEEDSGARIAFSAITAVIPAGGLLIKFAASMLGSQALKSTWAEGQRQEADELALALLDLSGRSSAVIALNLKIGLRLGQLPDGEWGRNFTQSIERVARMARAKQGIHLANVE